MEITTKTDDALKKLAADIVCNLVFTNLQLDDVKDIGQVFMVLFFLDENTHQYLRDNPPGLVYEYYSEASPRGWNGYPTFMSARFLTREDAVKVFALVDRLQAAMKQALE